MTTPLAVPLAEATAVRETWRRSLAALALLLTAVVAVHFDTFRAMVMIWDRSGTFTHCFVVPPISLWLIWRQREALAKQQPRASAGMLLALAALGFAWLLGELVETNAVRQLAATAMLVLVVPTVLGWHVARVILFPLMYLFFAVPIGEFLLPQLMQGTADFTVAALRLSGIPVYREGLQFVIPSGHWSVIEACSGVRYLMASFMVGSLFAYLNYRSYRRRVVFGIVSLLVPVVANWVRAYMIVLLGHLSSNRLAVGVDHLIYGWVFFGVVITLVFMIGARWAEGPDKPASGPAWTVEAGGSRRTWAVAGVAVLLLLPPSLALQRIDATEPTTQPRLVLPGDLGLWRQMEPEAVPAWRPDFVNASAEQLARYGRGQEAVGVYLGFYRRQDAERKLVSSENVLISLRNVPWKAAGSAFRTVTLADGRTVALREFELLHAEIPGESQRRALRAWQLYWVDDGIMVDEYRAKLAGALQRLRGHGDDSAVIVVFAHERAGESTAAALEAFTRENLGRLEAVLRATRDGR